MFVIYGIRATLVGVDLSVSQLKPVFPPTVSLSDPHQDKYAPTFVGCPPPLFSFSLLLFCLPVPVFFFSLLAPFCPSRLNNLFFLSLLHSLSTPLLSSHSAPSNSILLSFIHQQHPLSSLLHSPSLSFTLIQTHQQQHSPLLTLTVPA